MAKAVFRPGEVAMTDLKIVLEAPFQEAAKPEEEQPLEAVNPEDVFEGPTAEQLRQEAEEFKNQWETEKTAMINAARAEADLILNDARIQAEEKLKDADANVAGKAQAAEAQAAGILQDAETKAQGVEADARSKVEDIKADAKAAGFEEGRAAGFEAGMEEVKRLVTRTQVILKAIQDKREAIFSEAEQQVIDLALLVARKVVKGIAETQRTVVVDNIKEALAKVKKIHGTITIKVNLADLELSTAHLQEFTSLIEGGGDIQIHEDSSVDAGGCVISTDFGEIDARIASQFAELESKILSISPMRSTM